MANVNDVEAMLAFLAARLDEAQHDAEAMEHDRDWDDDYRSCLVARIGTIADEGYSEADCTCDLAQRKTRALREVEAKRLIVASCTAAGGGWSENFPASALGTAVLRQLAAVDSDHPDYRPEWKP